MKLSEKISQWRHAATAYFNAMSLKKKVALGLLATASKAGTVWAIGPVYSLSAVGLLMILPMVAQGIMRDVEKAHGQRPKLLDCGQRHFVRKQITTITAFAGLALVFFGAGFVEKNEKLNHEAMLAARDMQQQAYDQIKDKWQENERRVTLQGQAWQRDTRDWVKKPRPLSVSAEMTGPSEDGLYSIRFGGDLSDEATKVVEGVVTRGQFRPLLASDLKFSMLKN